jgi:hypothetical protein
MKAEDVFFAATFVAVVLAVAAGSVVAAASMAGIVVW